MTRDARRRAVLDVRCGRADAEAPTIPAMITTRSIAAVVALTLPACAVINRMDGASQARQLQRVGLPAQATIVRIWDTGMTVNKNPVVGFLLEVQPANGASWQAKTKLVVSRLAVSRVQPGAVVPVRYDPNDHARVSLALAGDGADFLPQPAPTPLPRAADLEPEKQRLLATGLAGTVTILECTPLGLFDADGRPVWDLMLSIELPGREPVRGPARTAVPKERESWFKVGQRLPIKADPEAPTHFAVDWDRVLP